MFSIEFNLIQINFVYINIRNVHIFISALLNKWKVFMLKHKFRWIINKINSILYSYMLCCIENGNSVQNILKLSISAIIYSYIWFSPLPFALTESFQWFWRLCLAFYSNYGFPNANESNGNIRKKKYSN